MGFKGLSSLLTGGTVSASQSGLQALPQLRSLQPTGLPGGRGPLVGQGPGSCGTGRAVASSPACVSCHDHQGKMENHARVC